MWSKFFGVSCLCSFVVENVSSLKPEQRSSMEAIYDGRDVFVWLPTGYGKSLCYQVLPFLVDSKLGLANTEKSSSVFVVSRLVVLMIDQVSTFLSRIVSSL